MTVTINPIAKIGVLLDRTAASKRWTFGLNVFEAFLGEILEHRGIAFDWIESADELASAAYDIVLVALADETKAAADALWAYAERGGVLIAYGSSLHGLAAKLGFQTAGPQGAGYAQLGGTRWFGEDRPLRFLDAVPWIPAPSAADGTTPLEDGRLVLGRPDGEGFGPALQRFAVGRGAVERWAVPIPATVAGLQLGTKPVLEDGVPAADGTIPVNDGVLKADDAAETDPRYDRAQTAEGAYYFAHPYADLWREVLIAHLLHTALDRGLTVPFTGYWPNGVSHVALLSLDSDHTGDVEGTTTLDLLAECGVPATWCMMEKEYSRPMYDRIRDAGHELALHYNAVWQDNGSWGADEFRRQADWFRATTGETNIVSNKNHVTRVEGWGELFRFCEDNGVASDQTRGNSKKGSVGYLFGNCHPYFPIAWADERNRLYDVLEIGFLYGDFLQLDTGIIEPLLEQARRVEGVAHFVFHQIHIHRKNFIRDWLRTWVNAARAQGFAFRTGRQINDWERYRRSVRIAGLETGENGSLQVLLSRAEPSADRAEPGRRSAQSTLPAASPDGPLVVWVPVRDDAISAEGEELYPGVFCRKIVLI